MNLLQLQEIRKAYTVENSAVEVLKGIDMSVERGEFIALMGASGSGKTTLMNIIGFLDVASSGRYLFDGEDVSNLNDDQLSHLRNRKVGFIFQSFSLIPFSNVLENVLLPVYYTGEDVKKYEKRAMQLLEDFGIADKRKSRPNQLSGGQQQRVAIARALINDPDLILADEPTGQLDSQTAETIMQYITRLHERGKTVIVVTHDAATAGHAKRIVRIADGRIL